MGNPLVSAEEVVTHLWTLSKAGVGYRAVSDVSGIHPTTLQRLKNGQAKYIRERSAMKILAITADAPKDGAKIPAKDTQRRVKRLLRVGFTEDELAQRLGRRRLKIATGKTVIAANAMQVEKLYNTIMAGEEAA